MTNRNQSTSRGMMNHLTRATIAVVAAELAMAGSIAVSGMIGLHGHAQALPGLQEDDPGWSCVDNGDHVCGPAGDDWGHTPGCYDQGGVLIALWPCAAVVHQGMGALPGPAA